MKYTNKKILNTQYWSFPARLVTVLGALLMIVLVPLTIYYTNQQKQTQSNAAASTTLSFSQSTVQANAGSPITLDITMNPGNNFVSLATIVISYDSSVMTPDTTKGFVPNTQVFPQTLDGPTYGICSGNQCTMSISLSVGNDPTKAIKTAATIATVNFTPVAQNGTTQLAFSQQTQVFSVAPTDQANENVLSTTTPASITIGQGGGTNPTPFPTTAVPSPTQSSNPTPTTGTPTTGVNECANLDTTTDPKNCGLNGSNIGLFCGGNCGVGGNPNTLYQCKGKTKMAQSVCSTKCITCAGAPNADACGTSTSVCGKPAPTGPITSPTPQPPLVCKQRDKDDDKDVEKEVEKARQHIDNVEKQINNIVLHKELQKSQRVAIAQKADQNLATAEDNLQQAAKALNIDTSTTGGCMGNFDPNNPNVVNDCNHPNAVSSTPLETFWNNIVNKFQNIFGGQ